MIADRNRIFDGFVSLEGGVDAGRSAILLGPHLAVSPENLTFRGGRPRPRPGIRQLTETFTNPEHGYNLNGVEIPHGTDVPNRLRADYCYKHDVFQTICAYSPHKGDDCLMALIGGRLFKIVPGVNSARVSEITVTDAASPYHNLASRNVAGGTITAPLNQLNIDPNFPLHNPSRFTPMDIGATVISSHYPGGSTVIKDYVGPLHVITTENGTSTGTGHISFTINSTDRNAPYRNHSHMPIAYMVQADKYLIAQDGISKAIIYDGKKARRANLEGDSDSTEIPTGTMMAYGMGR